MNKSLFLFIILQFTTFAVFAQSKCFNYVKSTTYLSADTIKKITGVSYTNAIGQPMQTVLVGASPSGKDIVQTYRYDSLGRVSQSWLPFTNTSQNGTFVYYAEQTQEGFWQNQSIEGADIPYAEAEYDNSPYNRVIRQSSPGENINNVNVSGDFEPAGGITLWEVSENNQLIKNGNYAANSLMKLTATDTDDKEIYVYKDKSGKVLLKEQSNTKTSYVYDKFGQLRYVLSPEAVSRMTGSLYNKNSDLVKQYCYYYEYNSKHQLVSKQLPGKEPTYLRYDDLYRLRITQDGNQRAEDKWMFINYDKFGRTVSTGLGTMANDSVFGDTINPPPVNGMSPFFTYNYYENYNFISDANLNFDANFAYHAQSSALKGKATGSKVRVMNPNTEEWLTSVVYYDKYGRNIQSITQNYVGGHDWVSNKYDFAGQLLETKHKHTTATDTNYLVYLYTYDDMGRLLKTELSQNEDGSGAVVINAVTYNELGQATEKKIHSENDTSFLQTVDFVYNIKGAITDINNPQNLGDDLFGMSLFYDTEAIGQTHQTYEDGKISAMQWNSKNLNALQTYIYEYDDLNRLTDAVFTPEDKYSVNYNYDLNGNITSLNRKGEKFIETIENGLPVITQTFGMIDSLTYSYNGNRLLSVHDAVGDFNASVNHDFRDQGSFATEEYFYDANGNMTKDLNKGIDSIAYNHLNQPIEVQLSANDKTVYLYTATGGMLKTEIYEGGLLKSTTQYSGAYMYENDTLNYINIPGGRIVETLRLGVSVSEFQYNLTDHLGNVRVTFTEKGDTASIIQEDHYYPFGMKLNGQSFTNTDLLNKFLYNGKELQEQTNYYDYGFRQMDAQLGRWHVVDAMAEEFFSISPYTYASNNPINNIDLFGLMTVTQIQKLWDETPDNGVGIYNGGGGSFTYYDSLDEAENDGVNFGPRFNAGFYSRGQIKKILKLSFGTNKGFKFKKGSLSFDNKALPNYTNLSEEEQILFDVILDAIEKTKDIQLNVVFSVLTEAWNSIDQKPFNLLYGDFGGGRLRMKNKKAEINVLSSGSDEYQNGELLLYSKGKTSITRMEFLFWHEIGHFVYSNDDDSYLAISIENQMRSIMNYPSRNYDEKHSLNFFITYYQILINRRQ